jgi:hypothetical protein
MSTYDEYKKMRPVTELVLTLDVSENPSPDALYDPLLAGFNIWCTPNDHPEGDEWKNKALYTKGTYAQKCSFIGSVTWGWTGERITHIDLETMAYEIMDANPGMSYKDIKNRPNDVEWAIKKTTELFSRAGVKMLPVVLG